MAPAPLLFARFSVYCLAFAGLVSGQQLARDFLDNTVVHDVRIDLSPDDWATLKQNYLDDTYYHGNVSSGTLAVGDVGVRSRGRGSRSPNKPNLDISIQKYAKKQKFAGLTFFILKANNQDASLMHELVAFELYRKMGLPAPREAPARLYVNGEYLGFYTIVEHEDEDYLDRNLGENDGDLFEWKPNAFYHFEYLGDDPAPYANLLDAKTNEDNPDYQKFIDMVKAINYSADADFVTAVSPYLDLKLYLTLVATENTIAEIDGLWESVYGTNNIYVYRFDGQSLFQFLAWDKDLTFWETLRPLPLGVDNVLARRLMAISEYKNFYLAQVAKAVNLLGGSGGWADQEVDRIYALIHDDAVNDPNKQCIALNSGLPPSPCGPNSFEQGVRDMHAFIAARAPFVQNWLSQQRYQPGGSGPTINSVMLGSPGSGGEVVPGSIVTIKGSSFGQDTIAASSSPPRSAGRSFIAVDGVRTPILSLSPSEALVQIPWDIPMGSASVSVAADGALGVTVSVPVVTAAPDILAVVHTDGSVLDANNPADAGENVTLYATGLGAVESSIDTGDPAPAGTLIHTLETPSLMVGSEQATVLFAGLSPGLVGTYQINIALPANMPSGNTTISVSLGGKTTSVQIPIR